MKWSVAYLFAIIGLGLTEPITRYNRYKVYQVTPKSVAEAELLKSLENNEGFDYWTELRVLNAPVDIMVSPNTQNLFEDLMKTNNVNYDILVNDVEEAFEQQRVQRSNNLRVASGEVTFEDYMRYDEIVAYLQQLAIDYPDVVTVETIGRTFEGRDVYLIRISSGGSNKPTIFAEAAIHAREWIAPPVALYVINQLVENPENRNMYEDVDWAIIPVANPDGYEYSQTVNKLWRKTRTPGVLCHGTDPNRNFDHSWRVIGASNRQCAEDYAGYKPFSEPETQIIRDYTQAHKDDIKLYLAIHSRGQWLLYPWGDTTDEPDNVEELNELGGRFREAVYAVNGTVYTVGTTATLLYHASGNSVDYAKAVTGIDLGYTIELPAAGAIYWDPPTTSILPVVEETWEGFKVFQDYIRDKFGPGSKVSLKHV